MGLRSTLLLLTLKPKLIMIYLHIVTFIKKKHHLWSDLTPMGNPLYSHEEVVNYITFSPG